MSAKWDRDAGFERGNNLEPDGHPGSPEANWGRWTEERRNHLPFSYSQIHFSCEIAVPLEYRVPSGHDETRAD